MANERGSRVRVVARHFAIKPNSESAHVLIEAAARVDIAKSLELLQAMFANPPAGLEFLLGDRSAEEVLTASTNTAGLEYSVLRLVSVRDLLSLVVARDTEEARRLGFSGTPGIVINGVRVHGALDEAEYRVIIDRFLEINS